MNAVLGGRKGGNLDLLALAKRGDRPLFDALGLEREAQFAFGDCQKFCALSRFIND
jgi:hypothetical protein